VIGSNGDKNFSDDVTVECAAAKLIARARVERSQCTVPQR